MARVAIPEPTSFDAEYNGRSFPLYCEALRAAGLEPAILRLSFTPGEIARVLARSQGALLPGSRADVNPQLYGEARHEKCAAPDGPRAAADELIIQDALNLRKPILAICHGMQALNVWRGGTLYQDLPSQMPTAINHAPGDRWRRRIPYRLRRGSRLAACLERAMKETETIAAAPLPNDQRDELLRVNSSHHQAVRRLGDNLVPTAISPVDGVIEAYELGRLHPEDEAAENRGGEHLGGKDQGGEHQEAADRDQEQFVLGVQWHPERTYQTNALSRAIFAAFAERVKQWTPRALVAP